MFNNKTLFDLIIIEQCFNDNEIETTIPSVKNNFANLLTPNGIFSLNIRSCSIYNQNYTINNLKKSLRILKKSILEYVVIFWFAPIKIKFK